MTEDFVVVKRKKGRNGVVQGVAGCMEKLSSGLKSNTSNLGPEIPVGLQADNETVLRKVNSALSHLESSGFSKYCKERLDEALRNLQPLSSESCQVSKIVSFGLGNFSTCQIARYQLALLIALQKHLRDSNGQSSQDVPVELFDPVFTPQEKVVLTEVGFEVLAINEEGERTVHDLTLFYLPHCSHQLVNNLLFSNWSLESINKCVVVANSFSNIHESVPQNILCRRLLYIARAKEMFVEFELESRFQYNDVFNDTSIHIFPSSKVLNTEAGVWDDRIDPTYDETDFVSDKLS